VDWEPVPSRRGGRRSCGWCVDRVLFSQALAAEGAVVFAKARELGLEGIVSNRQKPQLAEDREPEFRQDVTPCLATAR
jgi:hypothetical protein